MTKIGISNSFLRKIGTLMSPQFEGVWSCDLLLKEYKPRRKSLQNTSIIFVNTASSNMKNGHFCSISIRWQDSVIIVFCSLMLSWFDPNIAKFLKEFLEKHPNFSLQKSPFQIQSHQSFMCGIHVLGFLGSQEMGETLKNYYSRYERSTNLKSNDQIALNFVVNFIEHM